MFAAAWLPLLLSGVAVLGAKPHLDHPKENIGVLPERTNAVSILLHTGQDLISFLLLTNLKSLKFPYEAIWKLGEHFKKNA